MFSSVLLSLLWNHDVFQHCLSANSLIKNSSSAFLYLHVLLYTAHHSLLPMLQQCFCLTWLNWDFADSFNDSRSLFLRYLWGKSKKRRIKQQQNLWKAKTGFKSIV